MTATVPQRHHAIEWSVASRTHPTQAVSGDLHAVVPWDGGVVAAVVDGLGHGDEATAAARTAIEVIERHAAEPVVALVQHCHRALLRTRGVVMTLVSFSTRDDTMAVLGIGNVETVILRANAQAQPRRESVILRGGVVGYQLPPLQPTVAPIAAGDLVVFATDGVREDFSDSLKLEEPLPQLVERVLTQKFRGTDDGLVFACKYVGNP